MYKSNVFYQQFEVFITVSVFKNVNFVKPNWFVSLVFPIPEEGPAVPLVEAWLPFGRGNRRDTNQFVKKKITLLNTLTVMIQSKKRHIS